MLKNHLEDDELCLGGRWTLVTKKQDLKCRGDGEELRRRWYQKDVET
jgi:hypothetical protein